MDHFTVGDRCLVHRLESEAGQPLNGQHVTLADAIIQKGRFKCKFDDGSFACIKPCNLQIISGDRANQTTETCEKNASSNLSKTEDQIKKEVTTDDDKKETAATSTTTQPQDEKEEPPPTTTTTHRHEEEKGEECSICLDLLPKFGSKFMRAICCGKGMHNKCREDMIKSKMSQDQKSRCVMCRTKYADDTKKGRKEVIKQLRKWVKKGRAWAQAMLACRYRDGEGVEKDEKRAVVLYNLASEQGNAGAQYNLGIMYRDGRGADKDEKRAIKVFNLAAEQDNADAQSELGFMYCQGEGVDKDAKRAIAFYTLAADQGHTRAQFNLGIMYEHGQGVDKDAKRAVELYTLAADQGLASAQYNVGLMYAYGQGVDQSVTKAREWLTKAAAQGKENAINALKKLDEAEGRTTTPSSTVKSNTTFCSYCNKPEPPNRCQRCRSVSYCNRECQIKHWKTKPNGHKKQCKKLAAAFKTLNKKKEK